MDMVALVARAGSSERRSSIPVSQSTPLSLAGRREAQGECFACGTELTPGCRPGSSLAFPRALGTEGVVGRRGFIHIETEPSDYRISLKVVGVPETADVSPGLAIYVEGSALNDLVRLQARKLADRELLYVQHREQEKARADVEAWRKKLLQNVRADYQWGGDFRGGRVVDDRVQTFITVPDASDRAVIQFVDKAGKTEVVNYELENGVYVIQNKVLPPGEKCRLVLGKQ